MRGRTLITRLPLSHLGLEPGGGGGSPEGASSGRAGKWPGQGRSGQGASTTEILRGFDCNLKSDKPTSLKPAKALQPKIKSSGVKRKEQIVSTGRQSVGAGANSPGVERRCQSTGGREEEQDEQRICRKAQEGK